MLICLFLYENHLQITRRMYGLVEEGKMIVDGHGPMDRNGRILNGRRVRYSNVIFNFCYFEFPSKQQLSDCVSMNIGNAPRSMWTNSICSTLKSFICQSEFVEQRVQSSVTTNVFITTTARNVTGTMSITMDLNKQLNNCYRVDDFNIIQFVITHRICRCFLTQTLSAGISVNRFARKMMEI